MNSLAGRLVGIVVCAAVGALLGWTLTRWLALDGTPAALAAAVVAMVVAAAGFAGWTTLGRRLERSR